MTSHIQAVSEAGKAATVSPLHMWGNLSQVARAQILSRVYPSSVTTLGTSWITAPLTYDPIELLQAFSPNISTTGLNAAQQQELTSTLGLNAHATSTGAPGTNDALMLPTGEAQALANVLVGESNAAAEKANPSNPGLYNEQGVIEGVPADGVSQASDAVTGAQLNLGTTGGVASTANPVSNTSGGVTEKQFATGTEVVANSVAAANQNHTTTEKIAMAEYAAVLANPPGVTAVTAVAAGIVTEVALAAEQASATNQNITTAKKIAIAEYAASLANPAAETALAVKTEAAATAAPSKIVTPATTVTNAVIADAISATPITEAMTAVATTVPATIAAAKVATTTQALQSLPAANEAPLPVNSPAPEMNVVAVQTATTTAASPAIAKLGADANILTPPAIAPTVTNTIHAATTATANTIPVIEFDNARSVLQSLIAEAVAHATIRGNPASAAYSLGGAMFQMGTGADHVQQYIIKDYQPDIPDMVRAISPIARVRGVTERQT